MADIKTDKVVEELDLRAVDLTSAQMIRIMNVAAKLLKEKILRDHLGGTRTTGKRLARNTGNLEKSVIARAAKVGENGVGVEVDIKAKYASVHFGAIGKVTIIRPVTKQALTIPLPEMIGPNKRALYAANSRSITGKFAKGGVLFGKLPGDQRTRRLFSLRKSVAVPVRIDIKQDLENWIEPQIVAMVNEKVRKVFDA